MNFQVVISRRAHEELLGAADWWAENRDAEQAAKWFVGFDEKLKAYLTTPADSLWLKRILIFDLRLDN